MDERKASPNAPAPPPLRALLDGIDRLGRLDGWIGGLCLAALTCLMLAEVIVRSLSVVVPSIPGDIPVAWEYSSYLMAATFTFGAAMTLRAGGHIRVSLLTGRLGPGPRRAVELLLALIGIAFVGFLALAMMSFTWEAFVRGRTSDTSGTRLWVPAAAITFGMCLLALQFVARAIQAALGLPLEDHRMRSGAPAE
jgi:TRAP-type C4-dicarboxylate transport system permease small subunit